MKNMNYHKIGQKNKGMSINDFFENQKQIQAIIDKRNSSKLNNNTLLNKYNDIEYNKNINNIPLAIVDGNNNLHDITNNTLDSNITNNITNTPNKVKQTKNKKKTIPATIKRLVWNKYIGEHIGKHKCYCCKVTDVTQLSFHCGHVISEKNGGDLSIENLRPICQNCNSSMKSTNMDDFMATHHL